MNIIKNTFETQGILVGSDEMYEWLLPWWWDHYSAHNDFPVAFIDFGMSKKSLDWCERKGEVIAFNGSLDFLTPKDKIDANLRSKWESLILTKKFWEVRVKCFKKPLLWAIS